MSSHTGDAVRVPPKVVLLHPDDNVLICVSSLSAGTAFEFEGEYYTLGEDVPLGHKIARRDMAEKTKILRYGAPVGSLYRAVRAGEWIHLHNLKSDYMASTTRKGPAGESEGE